MSESKVQKFLGFSVCVFMVMLLFVGTVLLPEAQTPAQVKQQVPSHSKGKCLCSFCTCLKNTAAPLRVGATNEVDAKRKALQAPQLPQGPTPTQLEDYNAKKAAQEEP